MNKINIYMNTAALLICIFAVCGCGKDTFESDAQLPNTSQYTVSNTFDLHLPLSDMDANIDMNMPSVNNNENNIGDDRLVNFYQPCMGKMDNLPAELMNLVDNSIVADWIDNNSNLEIAHSSLDEYINIYSFINTFNIDMDDALKALEGYFECEYLPEELSLRREDIEIMYSDDKEEIAKHFASEYSIVVGEYIYSPQWIYLHNVDDYISAGITKEMIQEKMDAYSEIPLSYESRTAFESKLGQFLGETIQFSGEVYISP